jgi:hypothetical protein
MLIAIVTMLPMMTAANSIGRGIYERTKASSGPRS